jgi:palmitoyltransferase
MVSTGSFPSLSPLLTGQSRIGGPVSETTKKFFLQFGFWVAIYATVDLPVSIYAIVKEVRDGDHHPEWKIHWIVEAAVTGFGWFVAMSIVFRFGLLAARNQLSTEVTKPRIYTLAVKITDAELQQHSDARAPFRYITLPVVPPAHFAILELRAGENPWDVGFMGNLKLVMGNKFIDWLLPLRYSPCCNHDSTSSEYPMGPAYTELLRVFFPDRFKRRRRASWRPRSASSRRLSTGSTRPRT